MDHRLFIALLTVVFASGHDKSVADQTGSSASIQLRPGLKQLCPDEVVIERLTGVERVQHQHN